MRKRETEIEGEREQMREKEGECIKVRGGVPTYPYNVGYIHI